VSRQLHGNGARQPRPFHVPHGGAP
jgi:hypothetical protein